MVPTNWIGKMVLPVAAGGYLLASTLARSGGWAPQRGRTVPVLLCCEGRRQLLRALVDTGNTLTDPVTGTPVLLADLSGAGRMFPQGLCPSPEALRHPAELLGTLAGEWDGVRMRLLPYRSVGVEDGLLLTLRLDRIEVDGRPFPGKLLALVPGELGSTFHGLVGVW